MKCLVVMKDESVLLKGVDRIESDPTDTFFHAKDGCNTLLKRELSFGAVDPGIWENFASSRYDTDKILSIQFPPLLVGEPAEEGDVGRTKVE